MHKPESGGAGRRASFVQCLRPAVALGLLASVLAGEATAAEKGAKAEKTLSGPLFAVISIGEQRVSFYNHDGLAARASVSTGMRGHPTPTGIFSIVQKKRFHQSNIYSGAPMPFMQRITWSGIALHAGVLPGYPASHGCIRLPREFAQRMFGATKMGERVVVTPRDVTPFPIANKTLPVPYLKPAQAPVVASGQPAGTGGANAAGEPNGGVLETISLASPAAAADRALNPMEVAREMKRAANEQAKAAAQQMKAAQLQNVTRTGEARMAARKLSIAERVLDNAEDKLKAADRRLEKAQEDDAEEKAAAAKAAEKAAEKAAAEAKAEAEAKAAAEVKAAAAAGAADAASAAKPSEQAAAPAQSTTDASDAAKPAEQAAVPAQTPAPAETAAPAEPRKTPEEVRLAKAVEAKAAAEAAVAEAQKAVDEARAVKTARDQELETARQAAQVAKEASRVAASAVADADRRTEPLSVFISRKTGKLYVRQDWRPIFESPVTFAEPERSVGTHLYVSTAASDDGASLKWMALTMPPEAEPKPREAKGRNKAEAAPVAPVSAPSPPETAAGALDRITIPEDAQRRMAELAWVGASVIVSDHGISGETGETTDFIILTRSRASAPR